MILDRYFSPELEWGLGNGPMRGPTPSAGKKLFAKYDFAFSYFQILGYQIYAARAQNAQGFFSVHERDVVSEISLLPDDHPWPELYLGNIQNALYLELLPPEPPAHSDRTKVARFYEHARDSLRARGEQHSYFDNTFYLGAGASEPFKLLFTGDERNIRASLFSAFIRELNAQDSTISQFYFVDPGLTRSEWLHTSNLPAYMSGLIDMSIEESPDQQRDFIRNLFDANFIDFLHEMTSETALWRQGFDQLEEDIENVTEPDVDRSLASRLGSQDLNFLKYHHVLFALRNLRIIDDADRSTSTLISDDVRALLDADIHPMTGSDIALVDNYALPQFDLNPSGALGLDPDVLQFLVAELMHRIVEEWETGSFSADTSRVAYLIGQIAGRASATNFPITRDHLHKVGSLSALAVDDGSGSWSGAEWFYELVREIRDGIGDAQSSSASVNEGVSLRLLVEVLSFLPISERASQMEGIVDAYALLSPSMNFIETEDGLGASVDYWGEDVLSIICNTIEKASAEGYLTALQTRNLCLRVEGLLGAAPLSGIQWRDAAQSRFTESRMANESYPTLVEEIGARIARDWFTVIQRGADVWRSTYRDGVVFYGSQYFRIDPEDRVALTALRRHGVSEVLGYSAAEDLNNGTFTDDIREKRRYAGQLDIDRVTEIAKQNTNVDEVDTEGACDTAHQNLVRSNIEAIFGGGEDWQDHARTALAMSSSYLARVAPFYAMCENLDVGLDADLENGKKASDELFHLTVLENYFLSNYTDDEGPRHFSLEPQHKALAVRYAMGSDVLLKLAPSDFTDEDLDIMRGMLRDFHDPDLDPENDEGFQGISTYLDWIKEARTARGIIKDIPNVLLSFHYVMSFHASASGTLPSDLEINPLSFEAFKELYTETPADILSARSRHVVAAGNALGAIGRVIGVVTATHKIYTLTGKLAAGHGDWRTALDLAKYSLSLTGDLSKVVPAHIVKRVISKNSLKVVGGIGNLAGAILMADKSFTSFRSGDFELSFFSGVVSAAYLGSAWLAASSIEGTALAAWSYSAVSLGAAAGPIGWCLAVTIVLGGAYFTYRKAVQDLDVWTEAEQLLRHEGILVDEYRFIADVMPGSIFFEAERYAETRFKRGERLFRGEMVDAQFDDVDPFYGRLGQGFRADEAPAFVSARIYASDPDRYSFKIGAPVDGFYDIPGGISVSPQASHALIGLDPYRAPESYFRRRFFQLGGISKDLNEIGAHDLRLGNVPVVMPEVDEAEVLEFSDDPQFELLAPDESAVDHGQQLFRFGVAVVRAPFPGRFKLARDLVGQLRNDNTLSGGRPDAGMILGEIERVAWFGEAAR